MPDPYWLSDFRSYCAPLCLAFFWACEMLHLGTLYLPSLWPRILFVRTSAGNFTQLSESPVPCPHSAGLLLTPKLKLHILSAAAHLEPTLWFMLPVSTHHYCLFYYTRYFTYIFVRSGLSIVSLCLVLNGYLSKLSQKTETTLYISSRMRFNAMW